MNIMRLLKQDLRKILSKKGYGRFIRLVIRLPKSNLRKNCSFVFQTSECICIGDQSKYLVTELEIQQVFYRVYNKLGNPGISFAAESNKAFVPDS